MSNPKKRRRMIHPEPPTLLQLAYARPEDQARYGSGNVWKVIPFSEWTVSTIGDASRAGAKVQLGEFQSWILSQSETYYEAMRREYKEKLKVSAVLLETVSEKNLASIITDYTYDEGDIPNHHWADYLDLETKRWRPIEISGDPWKLNPFRILINDRGIRWSIPKDSAKIRVHRTVTSYEPCCEFMFTHK